MYSLSSHTYSISSETLLSPAILRDSERWEDFDERDMQAHFDEVYQEFVAKIRKLHFSSSKLTEVERKELEFMFESFIQAKLFLQDK